MHQYKFKLSNIAKLLVHLTVRSGPYFWEIKKKIKKCVRGYVEEKNEMLFTKYKYILHKKSCKMSIWYWVRDGIAEWLCFGVKYTLGMIIILYSTFAGQYGKMKALQSTLLLTK